MLEIENLQVRFPIRKGGVFGTSLWLKAVDQISLKVLKGQTMAIVGESGSGKTHWPWQLCLSDLCWQSTSKWN